MPIYASEKKAEHSKGDEIYLCKWQKLKVAAQRRLLPKYKYTCKEASK